MGPEALTSWVEFLDRLSGANIFTVVLLLLGLVGFFAWKLHTSYQKFARRCGVQKFLLTGYIQREGNLTPAEALIKTNKLTTDSARIE